MSFHCIHVAREMDNDMDIVGTFYPERKIQTSPKTNTILIIVGACANIKATSFDVITIHCERLNDSIFNHINRRSAITYSQNAMNLFVWQRNY